LYFSGKKVICFVGVDGSGKTTQAKHLLEFLQTRGYKSRYVRVASRPILLYPFLAMTQIFGYWTAVKKDAWTDPLENVSPPIRRRLGALYRLLLFVDFELIVLLKLHFQSLLVNVVICDRYVYDLILDLALSSLLSKRFLYLILRATTAPDKVFLADAPPGTIIKRRTHFALENVTAKINIYRRLAKMLDFTEIDTTLPMEKNRRRIEQMSLQLLEQN
jgi:dTMP kinase